MTENNKEKSLWTRLHIDRFLYALFGIALCYSVCLLCGGQQQVGKIPI